MSSEATTFPHRELTPGETKNIRFMAGLPDPDRTQVGQLLKGGRPLLTSNTRMLRLVDVTMAHTIRDLGANYDIGRRLFVGGALLFTCVYQFVNHEHTLPLHDAALTAMEQRDCVDLIFDGPAQLKEEAANFYGLLDRIVPVLGAGDEPAQIAYIGASMVHIALVESQQLVPPIPTQLEEYEIDPSFRDLTELFRQELG